MLVSSISINSTLSLVFLPIPIYFVTGLVTDSEDFSFAKNKRASFFYFALIVCLSLISAYKFI